MKLGIIGGGVVGKATARAFIEHVDEVRVYDIQPERRTHSLDLTLLCDLVMVCLPTPQAEGKLECDLTTVEQFFSVCRTYPAAAGNGTAVNYVLRSTVPIGTTRRFKEQYGLKSIVHSPEFLTARCALTDAQIPSRNIIGCPDPPEALQGGSFWPQSANPLFNLYKQRFPSVPIKMMSSDESESVKLFQNGFFAVKVAYWNEVRTLADKLGLDWERVMKAILADGRIAHAHTQVPGPDGKAGFGGSCLPKDLASLITLLDQHELLPWVTRAAHERNRFDRDGLSVTARALGQENNQ